MVTLLEEKTPKIAQEKNKFRHIPNLSTILPLFRMNTLNDHVGGVSNCDSTQETTWLMRGAPLVISYGL